MLTSLNGSSVIQILYIGHGRIQRNQIFCKVEPHLTFLNILLERQGVDIQSKVEELKEINQSLRTCDKLKDDAISLLSDQLVELSTRLQIKWTYDAKKVEGNKPANEQILFAKDYSYR